MVKNLALLDIVIFSSDPICVVFLIKLSRNVKNGWQVVSPLSIIMSKLCLFVVVIICLNEII